MLSPEGPGIHIKTLPPPFPLTKEPLVSKRHMGNKIFFTDLFKKKKQDEWIPKAI